MQLQQYWKVIQKNLLIILLITLLGIGLTVFYTLNQAPLYESTATLVLNPSPQSSLYFPQNEVATNLADSYSTLMSTRTFGESVAKELPFALSADDIVGSISTELVANTLFFRVSTIGDSPVQAQQLASTVVSVFLASPTIQQTTSNGQVNDVRGRIDDKLKYLSDMIKSYESRIVALEAQPQSTARDDELLQLRAQLVSMNDTETQTLVGLAQIESTAIAPSTAIVVDQPLPGARLATNLTRNLVLVTFVCLLAGIGLAFVRDYADYTVHSPEQLEEVAGLTPLAAIGVVGAAGYARPGGREAARQAAAVPGAVTESLVTLTHPNAPETESFRVLRTNIQFSSVEKPIHTMVVTSAAPGEGKSFTASNLAITIALSGKSVILVDLDLRKPSLHKLFKLPNTVGFTNLVVDKTAAENVVFQHIAGITSLRVITSGALPPNPGEILNSTAALEAMEWLTRQADYVIYDTPPAAMVADALLVSTRVDAVVLVINAGSTRRDVLLRVKSSLQKVSKATILPVLNRIRLKDLRGYYYYNYSAYSSDPAEALVHSNGKTAVEAVGAGRGEQRNESGNGKRG